jgi:hypothetical protein
MQSLTASSRRRHDCPFPTLGVSSALAHADRSRFGTTRRVLSNEIYGLRYTR